LNDSSCMMPFYRILVTAPSASRRVRSSSPAVLGASPLLRPAWPTVGCTSSLISLPCIDHSLSHPHPTQPRASPLSPSDPSSSLSSDWLCRITYTSNGPFSLESVWMGCMSSPGHAVDVEEAVRPAIPLAHAEVVETGSDPLHPLLELDVPIDPFR
jgi:hypothetical protein